MYEVSITTFVFTFPYEESLFKKLISKIIDKDGYLGNYQCNGNSDVFVQLFEWKWTDIANECEQVLVSRGYCGVQVRHRDG